MGTRTTGRGPLARLAAALVGPPLGWVASHPLRTAGAVGGLVALVVVVLSLGTVDLATMTVTGLTPRRLLRFSVAHPAYPAAVVVGLWSFLFWR